MLIPGLFAASRRDEHPTATRCHRPRQQKPATPRDQTPDRNADGDSGRNRHAATVNPPDNRHAATTETLASTAADDDKIVTTTGALTDTERRRQEKRSQHRRSHRQVATGVLWIRWVTAPTSVRSPNKNQGAQVYLSDGTRIALAKIRTSDEQEGWAEHSTSTGCTHRHSEPPGSAAEPTPKPTEPPPPPPRTGSFPARKNPTHR